MSIFILICWLLAVLYAARSEWVWSHMKEVDKHDKIEAHRLYVFMMCCFWIWNVDKMRDFVKFKL